MNPRQEVRKREKSFGSGIGCCSLKSIKNVDHGLPSGDRFDGPDSSTAERTLLIGKFREKRR